MDKIKKPEVDGLPDVVEAIVNGVSIIIDYVNQKLSYPRMLNQGVKLLPDI